MRCDFEAQARLADCAAADSDFPPNQEEEFLAADARPSPARAPPPFLSPPCAGTSRRGTTRHRPRLSGRSSAWSRSPPSGSSRWCPTRSSTQGRLAVGPRDLGSEPPDVYRRSSRRPRPPSRSAILASHIQKGAIRRRTSITTRGARPPPHPARRAAALRLAGRRLPRSSSTPPSTAGVGRRLHRGRARAARDARVDEGARAARCAASASSPHGEPASRFRQRETSSVFHRYASSCAPIAAERAAAAADSAADEEAAASAAASVGVAAVVLFLLPGSRSRCTIRGRSIAASACRAPPRARWPSTIADDNIRLAATRATGSTWAPTTPSSRRVTSCDEASWRLAQRCTIAASIVIFRRAAGRGRRWRSRRMSMFSMFLPSCFPPTSDVLLLSLHHEARHGRLVPAANVRRLRPVVPEEDHSSGQLRECQVLAAIEQPLKQLESVSILIALS